MKTTILGIIFFTLSLGSVIGQSSHKALNIFLQSDFIVEFDALAEQAERSVLQFKIQASQYPPESALQVESAYNASARQFNQTLVNIKRDLMDKERRTILFKFPDAYAKQVELDMLKAKAFYADHYLMKLNQVTQMENAGFISTFYGFLQYAEHAFRLFTKLRGQVDQYNVEVIDEHLIEAHRFKYWAEIQ